LELQAMTARDGGIRILVVDDDEDTLQIAAAVLNHAGYAVTLARTATEAMRIATLDPPAAAIIDLILPDFHGMELIQGLRGIAGLANLPVVAITGRLQRGVEVPPNTFNAACILTKPVWPKELLDAVEGCALKPSVPRPDAAGKMPDKEAPPRP
jgi:two-component system, OmpR family, KDP operon response regulator KdpE